MGHRIVGHEAIREGCPIKTFRQEG